MSNTDTFFFTPEWPILHLDNHLLGLYKPAGLLVQGDESGEISLLELGKSWLKKEYHKPGRAFLGMVHRLDRPVAGVVLFCRTSKAAARISEQFRAGTARKTYLAVVEGRPEDDQGHLSNFIEKNAKNSKIVSVPTEKSRIATLSYRVLDTTGSSSLLEVQLETGRKHQIRLQFSYLGHPILGDKRYGSTKALDRRQIALFAKALTIMHPTRNAEITIDAPLPKGWTWRSLEDTETPPPWNWEELHLLIGRCRDLVHLSGL